MVTISIRKSERKAADQLENDGYGALIAKLKDEITGYITDFRERAMSLLRNNEAQLLELKDETRETFSDFNRRLTHLEIQYSKFRDHKRRLMSMETQHP